MKIVFLFLFLTVGCATNVSEAPVKVISEDDGSFALTKLGEAALPQGKCGMVLWTLNANAATPILRYVSGEIASIVVGTTQIDLKLAQTRGGGDYGVFEYQTFTNDIGYHVTVEVNFGPGFDGGNYLERGVVTVKAPNSWEVVAPTAGIAGCRTK